MHLPYPVVLASGSPRRKELLKQLVPEYEVLVSLVDEEAFTCQSPIATAERLSLAKAKAVSLLRPFALVLGADTVVAYRSDESYVQLAKPNDEEDACRMLRELSGREHQVITGVALVWPAAELVFSDSTSVRFRALGNEEIARYVATGEPLDKAGAYAIQGGASAFVDSVDGSVSNVIGLPLERLATVLDQFGSSKFR